jgi:uncharacterized protein
LKFSNKATLFYLKNLDLVSAKNQNLIPLATTKDSYMIESHLGRIAGELNLPNRQVLNTFNLLEEGATIPFIARYRKEATGSLDEVQIESIQKAITKYKDLDKRKESILKSIEEQGKLTEELKKSIDNCFDPLMLEDIYLPYKRKRKTKGSVAKEKGLEPLAQVLFLQKHDDVERLAEKYITEDVKDIEEALEGARHIMSEWINEDQKVRNKVRFAFEKYATVKSKVARGKDEEGAKYRDYFDFEERLNKIPSHRLLAIRRGEEEGFLRVIIAPDEEQTINKLERFVCREDTQAADEVFEALEDAYKRLLSPSIETEFRNLSKDKADEEAIEVFTENLRQLLLSAPLGQKSVLGLDPGYRTGCKLVVLSSNGDLLENTTIYPHPPQNQSREAVSTVDHLVNKHKVAAIAVGNGTASRETMDMLKSSHLAGHVEIFLVNESGASIYSASAIAREEFPDQDVTVRGAVSIGRRLMDPLAELVKIDPKSIGVGQYQHDVNQPKLKSSLERVVESCVNQVGININTASKHLLTYVSGLGPTLAQNIVDYRSENGDFISRAALKKVPRMGAKAFEQCAGFLRVQAGRNPLDNTGVHPERYDLVKQIAEDNGCKVKDLISDADKRKHIDLSNYVTEEVGMPTLKDILKELEKPGLDPRGKAQPFEFAKGINKISDLNIGMILPGIVTNITNFGAFVDVGVKQDGLVHISEMADKFIENPNEVVKLQQKVQVKVTEVDIKRNRIQLSIKQAK